MNNTRNFKGVWIPKEIWLSKDLTPLEKMYLVEIDSLDDEETGCFASNKHFEEMFGQKSANATRIITNLKEKGWLDISYIYNGKEIDKRIIKVKRPPYPDRYYNNYNTYYKNYNEVLYKLEDRYYKNYKDSNTLLDKQLDIYNYYESVFGRTLNSIEYEMMTKWLEDKSFEQIKNAIDETAKSNIDNLKYVEKVLYSNKKKKNNKGWDDDFWNE